MILYLCLLFLLIFIFMTDIKYTTNEEDVLQFLYPTGFDTNTIHKFAILAG